MFEEVCPFNYARMYISKTALLIQFAASSRPPLPSPLVREPEQRADRATVVDAVQCRLVENYRRSAGESGVA
jgi:hypothetical protein